MKKNLTNSRKKRAANEWPKQLHFSHFDQSEDDTVGDVSLEEFILTIVDFYKDTKGFSQNPKMTLPRIKIPQTQQSTALQEVQMDMDISRRQKRIICVKLFLLSYFYLLPTIGAGPKSCDPIPLTNGIVFINYIGHWAHSQWDAGTNITVTCASQYTLKPSSFGNIWCDGNSGDWSITPECIGLSMINL